MKYNYSVMRMPNDNSNELIEYEKCMYKAFFEKAQKDNFWVKEKYIVNEQEKRLRINLPYNQIIIFCVKKNDKLIAARSINTNINNSQLKQMKLDNFIDISHQEKSCEALHLFCLEDNLESVKIIIGLNKYVTNYLYNSGFLYLYGVCLKKYLKLYLSMKMKIKKELYNSLNNEYVYVLYSYLDKKSLLKIKEIKMSEGNETKIPVQAKSEDIKYYSANRKINCLIEVLNKNNCFSEDTIQGLSEIMKDYLIVMDEEYKKLFK